MHSLSNRSYRITFLAPCVLLASCRNADVLNPEIQSGNSEKLILRNYEMLDEKDSPNNQVLETPHRDQENVFGGSVPDSFFVTDFVGMTERQAIMHAKEHGLIFQIGTRDGVDLPLTADFRRGRVTAALEDGVITGVRVE